MIFFPREERNIEYIYCKNRGKKKFQNVALRAKCEHFFQVGALNITIIGFNGCFLVGAIFMMVIVYGVFFQGGVLFMVFLGWSLVYGGNF